MTRAAARAARRAFGTAPFNPIGWVSSGAYGGAASKSFQLEGLSLTHETPGPVIKLEWVNAKSSTPGISWIFASTTEERTPSMLQLTLCNHPDLPDVVSDENRDAIKACYQRKLGVAEHTTEAGGWEGTNAASTRDWFGAWAQEMCSAGRATDAELQRLHGDELMNAPPPCGQGPSKLHRRVFLCLGRMHKRARHVLGAEAADAAAACGHASRLH